MVALERRPGFSLLVHCSDDRWHLCFNIFYGARRSFILYTVSKNTFTLFLRGNCAHTSWVWREVDDQIRILLLSLLPLQQQLLWRTFKAAAALAPAASAVIWKAKGAGEVRIWRRVLPYIISEAGNPETGLVTGSRFLKITRAPLPNLIFRRLFRTHCYRTALTSKGQKSLQTNSSLSVKTALIRFQPKALRTFICSLFQGAKYQLDWKMGRKWQCEPLKLTSFNH